MDLTTEDAAEARAARLKARRVQDALAEDRKRRWRRALRIREGWCARDFYAEDDRLRAEIAALIAAGEITRCPTGWALGAAGRSVFG